MENVFEPSFGNRPDCIVGRDDLLARVDRALTSKPGSRERAMLITGQRGMGKTALLLEIEARAKKAGFVTTRTSANDHLLESLIERLQVNGRDFVSDDKRKIQGVSIGAFGFSAGLTFSEEVRENYGFQTKLALLCDRLADCEKGVLLLVDEVSATSSQMRVLADTYQQLVGDGKNIAICMAGLPASISDVLNDSVLTFLNRAVKVRLGSLALPPIRSYYAATFNRAGVTIDFHLLDQAVEATAGFPYLLQLVGYYLLEESRETRVIDHETLSRSLRNAQDDMEDNVFKPTLAAVSAKDIAFLRALAKSALSGQGIGNVSEVAHIMGKENNYVQVYRRRLIDAGIIASPRNGQLEFTLPMMDRYLLSKK